MSPEQEILWAKIVAFELDDPTSSFTFTERLARENGWTIEFSARAIFEYKKFLFLICIAKQPLTPSDEVDQVWHLHLIYTESYWNELCRDTLGRPIHHGPTKGGTQERKKYSSTYDETKRFYTEIFKQEPPTDLWPDNESRFSNIHFQRVNIKQNWIIRKLYLLTR